MKALQARNTPPLHLVSRGYEGKRAVWAKEDAERESHEIPDPLVEFTDPLEHDWIRARYKWDKVRKIFYMNPNTREFMRFLLIVILPHHHIIASNQFDCKFCHISKPSTFVERAAPKGSRKRRVFTVIGEAQVGHPIQPGPEHAEEGPGGPAAILWTCARRRRWRLVEDVLP